MSRQGAKKLVGVLAIPVSITAATRESSTEAPEQVVLEQVPCIRYPVRFRKDKNDAQALIDSGSDVNAMTPAYASEWSQPASRYRAS